MSRIRKAVIPAAGWGTRMLPATKAIPKEMLPIVDRPAIQLIVEEAAASGIEQIILVSGRDKNEIVDHFDAHPLLEQVLREGGKRDLLSEVERTAELVQMQCVRQQRPLGLGHAILCARELIGEEPFIIFLPDDLVDSDPPCAQQLIDVYEQTGQSVLALMEVPLEQTSAFGIVDGTPRPDTPHILDIERMVEKPAPGDAPSRLAIVGRYVLSATIFDHLADTRPGALGEIQLTDGLAALAAKEGLLGCRFTGERYDAGNPAGLIQANVNWAKKSPEIWRQVAAFLRTIDLT